MIRFSFLRALAILAAALFVGSPKASAIEIGWAKADITPPEHPVPMRAGGQSSSTLDPISATAFAIRSDDAGPVVLISCDLIYITDGNRFDANMRDEVRKRVTAEISEVTPERIILMATHTHVAPSVQASPDYFEFACGKIANAAVEACRSRRSGGVSYGLGHAVVGHNRIVTHADGSSRMVGSFQKGSVRHPDFTHIEGFEDHSVHLLFTFDEERNLTGIVANVACPAQVQRGDKISADYWHEVRQRIAQHFGTKVHLLPQISAAGDIATTVMVEREAEKRMQQLRYPDLGEDPRAARRAQIAERIFATIVDVHSLVKTEIESEPILRHRAATLELVSGFPEPNSTAAPIPVELNAVRIGDVAIVTNPFELYLDYGIRIKGRSPAVQTFVVELAGSGSYLPTRRAVAGGAYGAIEKSCVFGPDPGESIVSETAGLLEKLWETP